MTTGKTNSTSSVSKSNKPYLNPCHHQTNATSIYSEHMTLNQSKWAAYDVARHALLMRINDVNNALDLEEAKTPPNRAAIAALEAELEALELKSDLISPDDFSGSEPHFIEIGDADDTPDALPMFITRQRDERDRRLQAVAFARASVGLEGFTITAADEERSRAYVDGEITLDEFIKRSIAST